MGKTNARGIWKVLISVDLLETVRVTILNIYIVGKIDSLSTSIAENFFKMYTFNDFLEARRDQCTGYWKSSRNITMADFATYIMLK